MMFHNNMSAIIQSMESDRMVKRPALCGLVVLFVLLSAAAPAVAASNDDSDDPTRAYSSAVVQNRKFDPTHEFSATVGVLPLDAFAKGVTASGSYTLHFTPHVAWEVAQFHYSFHLETDLNDKLAAFDIRPTPFELLDYYLTTNFVYSPLYWKGSWRNSGLAYGEFFLTVGGGYGWFTRSSRPGLSGGLGFRLYGSELLSFRLDARYLAFASGLSGGQFDIKDELWIGLGTSLSF